MRGLDLTPLFRSSVGFERMSQLLDAANRVDDSSQGFPPYNIEKVGDDDYQISMAIAGYGPDDVDIVAKGHKLVVKGKSQNDEDQKRVLLHRGIAKRAFERHFQLADHIEVGEATMEHGMLYLTLKRVLPEALKPRSIKISDVNTKTVIDASAS